MENTNSEEKNISEEVNDDSLPIVIEKQSRKKRQKQSEAQLETLRRGRERLAEKHNNVNTVRLKTILIPNT